MRKTLTIDIDEDLLIYTANCFGYQENMNYSQLIEQALFYFLKPQISNKSPKSFIEKEIEDLLIEPQIDINTIEKDYNFNLASIEGKWPGDEPVEQLVKMLSK
jgi:hypothetical protein